MSESNGTAQTREMSVEDMTKSDAYQELGRIAGFRGFARTQLHKSDMNSIYWYLTGETVARWMKFQTEDSPSYILLRRAIADACDLEYGDSWSSSRPFRRDELREMVRQMRDSADHRDFAEEGGE